MKSNAFSLAFLILGTLTASADVKMPAIFSDHMVLQEGKKLPVWGWAAPGEAVKVTIGSDSASATAAADGSWSVNLKPLPVRATGTTLTITGKNTITIQDVVVGEVWVASGQSNMELKMNPGLVQGPESIAEPANPQLRFFEVDKAPNLAPQHDTQGHWQIVAPDTIQQLSAVGYFFGREIQKKLNRPFGLIESDWGGQPIQTFMSKESLQTLPFEADHLKYIAPYEDAWNKLDPAAQKMALADFDAKMKDWQTNVDVPYQAIMRDWQKQADAAKAAGQPEPPRPPESQPRPIRPAGEVGWNTVLFDGMISPLIPYAIRGALWYQGESNGGDDGAQKRYFALLKTMITDWRARWGEGDFTFLSVGLANFGYRFPDPVDEGWAGVREGEVKVTEKLPNVGVAEAIDIGEAHGIHPIDKIDLGERLAASALHIAYGQKGTWSGPAFGGMAVGPDKIRIKFKHAENGLMIGASPHIVDQNPALPTDHLVGFAIAGADQKWVWADARIVGDSVVASSAQVPHPVAVRYGWANNPAVNLYNKDAAGKQAQPAEPFRTDNWAFVNPPNPPEKW